MWYHIKRITLVLLIISMFCNGCTLLKKSTKHTQQSKQETNEQTYLEQLDLKKANKETRIYTYWKDSSWHQYEHILENTAEAKHLALNKAHKQIKEQRQSIKKTKPPNLWIYGIIVIALTIIIFMVALKIKQRVTDYQK